MKNLTLRAEQRARQGMALLEVIVAMMILAIAAVSTVAWVNQAADAVSRSSSAAAQTVAASDYLDRIALWTREDLDRHLGARRQGVWTVTVERPMSALYAVTVADSSNARILLRTTLYRPEVRSATR